MNGEAAVRLARKAVDAEAAGRIVSKEDIPAGMESPKGVFVTLKTYPGGRLRGCIGYPEPVLPQGEAIIASAVSAASRDPRFSPVSDKETDSVTVEVTILTVPETIEVPKSELPSRIVIGRDGLIISYRGRRGLLLPQVPEEWGWDQNEYLAQLSVKAGLNPDAWMRPDAEIQCFRGKVFTEETPRGNVVEVISRT
ncbi:MAG: TIGR00296 family protein [Candidatus Methanomethylophilaceae archaeon]|nr:TIGR00296 family protein [Candidatus Methanomethylophilaceae archaeon]